MYRATPPSLSLLPLAVRGELLEDNQELMARIAEERATPNEFDLPLSTDPRSGILLFTPLLSDRKFVRQRRLEKVYKVRASLHRQAIERVQAVKAAFHVEKRTSSVVHQGAQERRERLQAVAETRKAIYAEKLKKNMKVKATCRGKNAL